MKKTTITSFEPIACPSARVLILGSIPGVESLAAGQYYAHPRNAFWRIMAEIVGFPVNEAYEKRVEALGGAGIALWDVLHSCIRQGSLDADIESGSVMVNDFASFFLSHQHIELVCFNGKTAEKCYRKRVLPFLDGTRLAYTGLPSTSPAYASLSFADKVAAWRAAIRSRLH